MTSHDSLTVGISVSLAIAFSSAGGGANLQHINTIELTAVSVVSGPGLIGDFDSDNDVDIDDIDFYFGNIGSRAE